MSEQMPIQNLRAHLGHYIVGQTELVDRLLIGLLTGGHLLVEGLPGLAKTTAIKALAEGVHANFKRIQFTPDLLPTDLLGNEIYHPETREFTFEAGPLFNEIVLADEINRAPAKVQSALLEAMAERQVTVAGHSRALPELFLVMATQNPLEQSGTYPLPEAQMDRFMLHVALDYPERDDEYDILKRTLDGTLGTNPVGEADNITVDQVLAAREAVRQVRSTRPCSTGWSTWSRAPAVWASSPRNWPTRCWSALHRAGRSPGCRPPAPPPSSRGVTTSFPTI